MTIAAPVGYVLHLADNALVLGQRNAEWCGHGPVLEEDLALTNNSLDLFGQARLLYEHAATLINVDPALAQRFAHRQGVRQQGRITEDTLAYFRDTAEFRNHTLLELPHHGALVGYVVAERDHATTIARNFLYSALMVLVWQALQASSEVQLAGIAAKSLKEVRYHLSHPSVWLVRFGDGTDESHARAGRARSPAALLPSPLVGQPRRRRRRDQRHGCSHGRAAQRLECHRQRNPERCRPVALRHEAACGLRGARPCGRAIGTSGVSAGRNAKPGTRPPASGVVKAAPAPA